MVLVVDTPLAESTIKPLSALGSNEKSPSLVRHCPSVPAPDTEVAILPSHMAEILAVSKVEISMVQFMIHSARTGVKASDQDSGRYKRSSDEHQQRNRKEPW